MEAVAWKHFRSGDTYFYVVQINNIKGVRAENRVKKDFKDWDFHGEGFDPKKKAITLMFRRGFTGDDDWIEWAREFPHDLIEVGKSGKKKPYKLGSDYKNSRRGRRSNVGK
jgi:hypothetical protein